MKSTFRSPLFSCLLAVAIASDVSAFTTVFMNYSGFTNRLNELMSSAGATPFSSAEEDTLKAGILAGLQVQYSAFDVAFSETAPGGLFPTLHFGLTGGSLGVADHIDYRNKQPDDTARVFTANFDFIIEADDDRADQISELTTALTGTAAHELGHNLGLRHHDAYGDASLTYVGTPINTGGVQNANIMSTGSTGLDEAGRENPRVFSEHSLVKLSFAEGLSDNVPKSVNEVADFGDSTGNATPLVFSDLTAVNRRAVNVVGTLGTETDADVFAVSLTAGSVLTADVNIDYPQSITFENVNSMLEIIGPDGSTIIASDLVTLYSGDTFGSGGSGDGFDPMLINVPIAETGIYYVRVSPEEPDTGQYELLIHTDSEGQLISGDFNDDGVYDCDDIDSLVAAIAGGSGDLDFDLSGDGFVNLIDRDLWLAEAGMVNLDSGNPYLLGDATLDGTVDGQDFLVWNQNKFGDGSAWCIGDFNADGVVDGQDFTLWNGNKFQVADGLTLHPDFNREESFGVTVETANAAAVPEPSAVLGMIVGLLGLVGLARR